MNVFPYPTGIQVQMSMTLSAAAREVPLITDESASAIAEHVAMPQAGNSGVILSQLLEVFGDKRRRKD